MTTTPHHPIAVIGAGLGGLMLARVLHVKGVEAAVYDLDASPTARPQGGMLDMHEESGQAALRAAGLYDAFRAIIHAGGEATRIIDKDGTLLREDSGEDGQRPEVSRGALRDVLLGSLPEGTVRWGAKATAVRTLVGGRHEVTLADGSTFTADLLIGADGAWSRVRPLLTDATPAYAGLSFVEMHLADADTRHPKGAGVVGGGLLFALADRKGFLGHRDPDGSLHVYAALRTPADWAVSGPVDFSDAEAAKRGVLEHFEGWDDSLRSLVAEADGALVARPIHALPVGVRWDRVPGVTLLGDAAHLMSPFAGEGANLAMLDGAELALALAAHPDDTEKALTAYEEALFPRSEQAAAESAANLEVCFGPGTPQSLLDLMDSYGPDAD
ncbi:NAD(P)/FAD-dependent oxidoreductase [Streptomyces sp. NPDC005345]|uniref:FAD-dependent oxidoreductase n=1 Tax=Streptomyces sp. NPDC005345 TaxID=3156877 RepID=UPI0033A9F063